ncbi:hypothetical protein MSAN_01146800 [Mycena sanguinolenta]|uniref:F-box domain-containing protein n=1 Tax=Mycena sanguinolenta TaxID=230812 RepID=A0A8H7D4H4_9AGAR|nr:hypothetical protein MSAN_01146800 [Mycena sanguinolenta]
MDTVCGCSRQGFCCISSEALTKVFNYLPLHDIQVVCSLSRRLNRLSVDILLAANGILDPTVKCHIRLDENSDALTALQFALFIPSMSHFSVVFAGTRDITAPARDMQRCIRILRKFLSIRDVTVEFLETEHDYGFFTNLKDWLIILSG